MRFSDSAIGSVLVLFGGWVLLYTRTFPTLEEGYPGPSLFPNVLAVLFVLAGIGLVIQGVRKGQKFFMLDLGGLNRTGALNLLFVTGVVLAYIFLAEPVGFLFLVPPLLLATLKWLKVSWKLSILTAAGVTLFIYLLFAKLLLVPLPRGILDPLTDLLGRI